eukprot:jgi/Undpi1/9940/HiC_scaffold_28.g12394.m1
MGGLQEAGGGGGVSRRVSFSTYKGPPILSAAGDSTTGINEAGDNNNSKQDSGVGGREGGGQANAAVVSTPQPLPKLQRRLSSQKAIVSGASPGKPPPPRPPGDPPAGQIRRYSISNELSGGFSRRMSAVSATGGAPDVAPKATATAAASSTASVAQNRRGAVLWYNMGVTKQKERDAKGAVECYERAANEGHAKAQHNLAAIYEKGVPGVPKNDAEAARLFRQAADQGLAESCYSYAMHLKFGLAQRRKRLVRRSLLAHERSTTTAAAAAGAKVVN